MWMSLEFLGFTGLICVVAALFWITCVCELVKERIQREERHEAMVRQRREETEKRRRRMTGESAVTTSTVKQGPK